MSTKITGMRAGSVWAIVIGASLTVVGCSKPPVEEIGVADAALATAETAEASSYAPEEFKAAADAHAELQTELAAQEEKFAPLRSYRKATELAAAVEVAAAAAQQKADAERERARQEATQLLADARTALQDAMTLLQDAPTGKGTQADIEAMKSDLAAVETSLQEADSAFATGKFADVRTKAQAALLAAGQVKTAVEQAMTARGPRRRV